MVSTTNVRAAPARIDAFAANRPMGPAPMTSTVAPGFTARFTEWMEFANGSVSDATSSESPAGTDSTCVAGIGARLGEAAGKVHPHQERGSGTGSAVPRRTGRTVPHDTTGIDDDAPAEQLGGDALADGVDGPDDLVAHDERRDAAGAGLAEPVEVRAADRGRR